IRRVARSEAAVETDASIHQVGSFCGQSLPVARQYPGRSAPSAGKSDFTILLIEVPLMSYCPQCHRPIADTEFEGSDALCPTCRSEESAEDSAWGNAARVTSLAEGGYLVSLLESEGIEARLIEADSF